MCNCSQFTLILQVTFTNQPLNVVNYHVLIVHFLIAVLKVQYILVKALYLLIGICSHVLLKLIKMTVTDMEFQVHPAIHFTRICHQTLYKPHKVLGFVTPQKAMNHGNRAVSSCILCFIEIFGELLAFCNIFNLQSIKNTGFNLCCKQLRRQTLGILESSRLYIQSFDKFFHQTKFKMKYREQYFLRIQQRLTLDIVFPQANLVHCGQLFFQ